MKLLNYFNFKKWFRSKRFWKRFIAFLIFFPILFISLVVSIVYVRQDSIVQGAVDDMNARFTGSFEIRESHISLFENFPYISIDIEGFKIYETKTDKTKEVFNLDHIYAGIDFWTILSSEIKFERIILKNGNINIIQHKDGTSNITNALKKQETKKPFFNLNTKDISIALEEINITSYNQTNGLNVLANIHNADTYFKMTETHTYGSFSSQFVLDVIDNGDTTFLSNKDIGFSTDIIFENAAELLIINPTHVRIDGAVLDVKGSINFIEDMFLDLDLSGNKPNFDLLLALAPEDIGSILKAYQTSGDIQFSSKIFGASINGYTPDIDLKYTCKGGQVVHKKTNKKITDIDFESHLSMIDSTTSFELLHFTAKPEGSTIYSNISISDFSAPIIKAEFSSAMDLSFISDFFELSEENRLDGQVNIGFHIDNQFDPKDSTKLYLGINKDLVFNLNLKDVKYKAGEIPFPIDDFRLSMRILGNDIEIDNLELISGGSDLKIKGSINEVYQFIDYTNQTVTANLDVSSKNLDLYELTGKKDSSMNKEISHLKMNFSFKAKAKSLIESKGFPEGEFSIKELNAEIKNYPHTLSDFSADVIIDENDIIVNDFKGLLDKSDFLIDGKLQNYKNWLNNIDDGVSKIAFNFYSKLLQLNSLFSYGGENYIPEDYRYEEFDDLILRGHTYLDQKTGLDKMAVSLDAFEGKMKIHPLRFTEFNGEFNYENELLSIHDLHGKIGKSEFTTTLKYYMGTNELIGKRDNYFSISSPGIDVDQLIDYNIILDPKLNKDETDSIDKVFNIYTLPFTEMRVDLDIRNLNYNRYLLNKIKGNARITKDHIIHLTDFSFLAAGGRFDIAGSFFNGSDPNRIYFIPKIKAKNIDLDKVLFKFKNFNQNYVISENLHGIFSGTIKGKILMSPDFTPNIIESEVHMDVNIINGKLENLELLSLVSDYFEDKDLDKVIFDTLSNHFDLANGYLTIPSMIINSSLGHIVVSGKQSISGEMDYQLRIPWKMISSAAKSKLFMNNKKKKKATLENIKNKKINYLDVKFVLDEKGYNFSLK